MVPIKYGIGKWKYQHKKENTPKLSKGSSLYHKVPTNFYLSTLTPKQISNIPESHKILYSLQFLLPAK